MNIRWIWVIGRRNIKNGDYTLRFGDRWDEYVDSITSYPYAPKLLGRSELADVEHDDNRAPVWGVVRSWRVISASEAAELGFDQVDEEALYAGVELNAAADPTQIVSISPSVYEAYEDEDGKRWPCVLVHISVVGFPAQQIGQPLQADIVHIALSKEVGMATRKSKLNDVAVDADAIETVEEAASEAVDLVAELQARIAELEAALEAALANAPAAEEPAEEPLSSEQLSKLIDAKVQAKLARERALDRVGAERVCKLSREDLGQVHATLAPAAWDAFVSSLPSVAHATPEATQRLSKNARGGGDVDHYALAKQIAKRDSITLAAAVTHIARGGK